MGEGKVVNLGAHRKIAQGLAAIGAPAMQDDDGAGKGIDASPGAVSLCEKAEPIMQFFVSGHLPEHLRETSRLFADAALVVVMTLPKNDERDMCLRKLLEAKDCAVRAIVAKQPSEG